MAAEILGGAAGLKHGERPLHLLSYVHRKKYDVVGHKLNRLTPAPKSCVANAWPAGVSRVRTLVMPLTLKSWIIEYR